MQKVRWGVLSTAKIAKEWLIPAMQESEYAEVVAVASRDLSRAQAYAKETGIPKAYGSYEELLQSDEVDAIYNPMPNHMHVSWSIEAVKAGKHLLCEKPLGLDAADAQKLVDVAAQSPKLVVMEAFMYRFHPQWLKIRELIESGAIGKVRQVQTSFTYFNRDATNVRNKPGIGGGGLLDIGCYCISAARFAFGTEPQQVVGTLKIDEDFQVDHHANGILDFGDGVATFNCSTQSNSSQMVNIIGEEGRIFVDTPFYKREDKPCELVVYKEHDKEIIPIGHFNHYVSEIDAFSQAVQAGESAPTPLADAMANMRVIDGIFSSHETGGWVKL